MGRILELIIRHLATEADSNQNYGVSSIILPVPLRAGSTNSEFNDAWQHYVIVQFGDYTTLYKNGEFMAAESFPSFRACNAITRINRINFCFGYRVYSNSGINAGVQGYYDDFMFFSNTDWGGRSKRVV